jgi:hypothetical protein
VTPRESIEAAPREFDLPDVSDDDNGPTEKNSLTVGSQSIVVILWQLLVSIMFFTWNEEHRKKNPKANAPAPATDNEEEVPAIPIMA